MPPADPLRPTIVTANRLLALLKRVDRRSPVILVATVVPQFRATADDGSEFPYKLAVQCGELVKQTITKGLVCADYATSVNTRRAKEGLKKDFVAKPRAWGERYKDSPVILHKGLAYLEVQVIEAASEYLYNGRVPDAAVTAELAKFVPAAKPSRQGVENEVVVRTFNVDNVHKIKLADKWYAVKG